MHVSRYYFSANVSVSIDGNLPTIHTKAAMDGQDQYHVILYDAQLLPFTAHTIDITLLNYTAASGNVTKLGFDYAVVNDTQSLIATPTIIPTPKSTAASHVQ